MELITKALADEGISPKFHRRKLAQLRQEWPVLFDALRIHMLEQGYIYDGWRYIKYGKKTKQD